MAKEEREEKKEVLQNPEVPPGEKEYLEMHWQWLREGCIIKLLHWPISEILNV